LARAGRERSSQRRAGAKANQHELRLRITAMDVTNLLAKRADVIHLAKFRMMKSKLHDVAVQFGQVAAIKRVETIDEKNIDVIAARGSEYRASRRRQIGK